MQEIPTKLANRTESFGVPWYSPLAIMFGRNFLIRLEEDWASGELATGIVEPKFIEDAGRLWEIRRAIEKKWFSYLVFVIGLLPQFLIQLDVANRGLARLFIYGLGTIGILFLVYGLTELLQFRIGKWEDRRGWPRLRRPYIPGSVYRPLAVLASASKLAGLERTQLIFYAAKILSVDAPRAVRLTQKDLRSRDFDLSMRIGEKALLPRSRTLRSQIDVWMRSADAYVKGVAQAILVANSDSTLKGVTVDIRELANGAYQSKWSELGDAAQPQARPRYEVWISFAFLSLSSLAVAVLLSLDSSVTDKFDKLPEMMFAGVISLSGIVMGILLQSSSRIARK